jgi:hypothetical protein
VRDGSSRDPWIDRRRAETVNHHRAQQDDCTSTFTEHPARIRLLQPFLVDIDSGISKTPNRPFEYFGWEITLYKFDFGRRVWSPVRTWRSNLTRVGQAISIPTGTG